MKSHSSSIPSLVHSLAARQVDRYLMARAPLSGREAASRHQPVITISRMLGIPAHEIGVLLGRQLGFDVFDREVLNAIAEHVHLAERIVESLDEGRRSALDSWIEGCLTFGERIVDPTSVHRMICRAIRGIALHGAAVIIGRGANFILQGTDAFRVRLVAAPDLRIGALMTGASGNEVLTLAEGEDAIERHAEERRAYMQRHFRADISDPLAYDVTFNLRTLEPTRAAELIVAAYHKACGD